MADRRLKDTPADERSLEEKLGEMMDEADREDVFEGDTPEKPQPQPRRQRE